MQQRMTRYSGRYILLPRRVKSLVYHCQRELLNVMFKTFNDASTRVISGIKMHRATFSAFLCSSSAVHANLCGRVKFGYEIVKSSTDVISNLVGV